MPASTQTRHDHRGDLKALFGLDTITYKSNLSKEELFYEAIANDRGRTHPNGPDTEQKAFPTRLGTRGPLVFYTDPTCTGRPVNDTCGVAWPELAEKVWWKADFGKFEPTQFAALLKRVVAHLNARRATLYVKDVYCGSDPSYARPYRLVSEYATHSLFCHNMFPKAVPGVKDEDGKRWTMLNAPSFHCDPARDGTKGTRIVCLDFKNRIVLVAGRADYCGVVKKSMFTVMNYLVPDLGEMSMHCSANVGKAGDCAILFGLSGTGKTTLSADPQRKLIGDDEHAWTAAGVSNLEDGCYAKLIDLDKKAEPVIAAALSMPGTIIENVPALKGRRIEETDPQDFELHDKSITENTRFSYPLDCNPMVMEGAKGPHPQTIVLLTADAFGVLPPISILEEEQVMYHFVSGFTAKLAGTEVGITEPKAAFSACFGAPFMAQKPSVYAQRLAEKMKQHKARCVLLNTGWSGGAFGTGKRISIKHTRALLDAALRGDLDAGKTEFAMHPVFNLKVPKSCPGVPAEILDPRNTWTDKAAYDKAALALRDLFRKNYEEKGFGKLGIKPGM
jgi:phosphoenolpyruvate carboxykinase (ATP)